MKRLDGRAAARDTTADMADDFKHGTVHQAAEDLQRALRASPELYARWQALTPLGRNEFICWVEDAKQPATRARRLRRTCEELLEGKKRPCCWAGCIHRPDKAPGRWQKAVLIDGVKRRAPETG
ncbi:MULTISPECIES: YdeI/OmpD-associated family protein [unclassified Sphingomonas]|uniref:YdeI/OmpD-associated family protein n=2 Tax=Sphingomonas TaxID=13687 RepID=UPI002F90EE84